MFEGEAAASVRSAAFERRLEEARAFGRACNGLANRRSDLSARGGLSAGQRAGGWALLGVTFLSLAVRPLEFATAAAWVLASVFAVIILLRISAALAALLRKQEKPLSVVADDDLPPLTILAPLYDEGPDVVASLIGALSGLDYPHDRLEVKLLLEADDRRTIDAVLSCNPSSEFELIPVPPGEPRTKPKALNLGLEYARGDIIAVFDAEDRPSPGQLREAVAAFRARPDLSVVQAPLLVHNGKEGWLARQFEIEYAILFRVWLPFLARLGLPLPLGGTSNYFRRDRLEAAGGWDAWNVTEDADLGIRLARFGGRAATITLPTWEEAPVRRKHWVSQRTRWMKGHLQTWLVLMRQPFRAAKDLGWQSFLATQLTLAGSLLASATHAPILLWMALGLVSPLIRVEGWHAAFLGVGYGSVLLAALAARTKGLSGIALVTLPFYWPLLSWAMVRAIGELGQRPHFWAKTPHGAQTRE